MSRHDVRGNFFNASHQANTMQTDMLHHNATWRDFTRISSGNSLWRRFYDNDGFAMPRNQLKYDKYRLDRLENYLGIAATDTEASVSSLLADKPVPVGAVTHRQVLPVAPATPCSLLLLSHKHLVLPLPLDLHLSFPPSQPFQPIFMPTFFTASPPPPCSPSHRAPPVCLFEPVGKLWRRAVFSSGLVPF